MALRHLALLMMVNWRLEIEDVLNDTRSTFCRSALLPCCALTFPREPQSPVLSQEVGGPAHPDLGRSQGGVTAGTRAGGQRRRQLPGGVSDAAVSSHAQAQVGGMVGNSLL